MVAVAIAKLQLPKEDIAKLAVGLLKRSHRAPPVASGSCLWAMGGTGDQGVEEEVVLGLVKLLLIFF
jgi:hypothetical protein